MIIPTIDKFFTAIIIIIGFWMVAKFFWMVIYQYKYNNDYGERYIKGLISKEEKKELKRRYKNGGI